MREFMADERELPAALKVVAWLRFVGGALARWTCWCRLFACG